MESNQKQKIKNFPFASKGFSREQKKQLKSFFSYHEIWDTEDVREKVQKYNLKKEEDLSNQESLNKFYHRSSSLLSVTEYALSLLGFQKISDNLSNHHKGDKEKNKFQIWAHEKGVAVQVNTVWGQKNNDYLVNSIHISTQLDLGMGFDIFFSAVHQIGGSMSSNFTTTPSSRSVNTLAKSVNNANDLIVALNDIQKKGRIIPFKDWVIKELFVHMGPEYLLTSDQITEALSKNNSISSAEMMVNFFKQSLDNIIQNNSMPEGFELFLQEGARLSYQYHEVMKEVFKETPDEVNKIKDWRLFEESFSYADHMTNFSLERFPSEEDKFFYHLWHGALSGNTNKNISPVALNYQTKNGYSWILCCAARASHNYPSSSAPAIDFLFDAIKTVNFDVLKNMCEVPDVTGMTLPLHLFNISMASRFSFTAPKDRPLTIQKNEVLSAIAQRYRENNTPLPLVGGEGSSINGIWLKNMYLYETQRTYYEAPDLNFLPEWISAFKTMGFKVNQSTWSVQSPYSFIDREYRAPLFVPPFSVDTTSVMSALETLTQHAPEKEKPNIDFLVKVLINEELAETIQTKDKRASKKM